jgi:hypothetical protein
VRRRLVLLLCALRVCAAGSGSIFVSEALGFASPGSALPCAAAVRVFDSLLLRFSFSARAAHRLNRVAGPVSFQWSRARVGRLAPCSSSPVPIFPRKHSAGCRFRFCLRQARTRRRRRTRSRFPSALNPVGFDSTTLSLRCCVPLVLPDQVRLVDSILLCADESRSPGACPVTATFPASSLPASFLLFARALLRFFSGFFRVVKDYCVWIVCR